MSAAVLPSEDRPGAAQSLAAIRADAGIRAAFAQSAGRTAIESLAERGGYRLKFPHTHTDWCEGVVVNTGGGVVGGDRVSTEVSAGPGTNVVLTTQSAERIYRSIGPCSELDVQLRIGPGGRLHWLPQETILFSGARLARRFDVELDESATLLMAETIVFGRAASGEEMSGGRLSDQWRVRRNGQLAFAEATRLDEISKAALSRPAVLAGARAVAIVLYASTDAEARLENVRSALEEAHAEVGASAWNGMLVMRAMGETSDSVRRDVKTVIEVLSGAALPRVWST
jgi:urease accessory protein